MTRRPLAPRKVNVAIDGNALNRDGSAHDQLVDRLIALGKAGTVNLIVPKKVREEVLDLKTPEQKKASLPPIFTLPVGLNSEEARELAVIKKALRGNAKSDRHDADADHLFEAAKYAGYFITHDERILKKSGTLADVLPPSLTVLPLEEFMRIFDEYEADSPS